MILGLPVLKGGRLEVRARSEFPQYQTYQCYVQVVVLGSWVPSDGVSVWLYRTGGLVHSHERVILEHHLQRRGALFVALPQPPAQPCRLRGGGGGGGAGVAEGGLCGAHPARPVACGGGGGIRHHVWAYSGGLQCAPSAPLSVAYCQKRFGGALGSARLCRGWVRLSRTVNEV